MSAPAGASSADVSSGSKRFLPAAATVNERHVLPPHFLARASPAAGSAAGDAAAAANESDHPPPAATRLYRHALESIFAFLNQRELAAALRVSRGWLAAVKSMASLRLAVKRLSVPQRVIAVSSMGRHVAHLGGAEAFVPLNADTLFILAHHMVHLDALFGKMEPADGPLTFPSGLQKLDLKVKVTLVAADVNETLKAISRLPLLESFTVHMFFINQVSFSPLASLPQLRRLRIVDEAGGSPELSDAQVDQLRALLHLRSLDVSFMSTSLLRRLLAQPHHLQWQEINWSTLLDDEDAALLPQLPSLTKLNLDVLFGGSHFEWLQQLPHLTHVAMRVCQIFEVAETAESLAVALQCCVKIEHLSLSCSGLLTAHLTDLLPRLPRLRTLELDSAKIASLSFLAQQPTVRQLSGLSVCSCRKLQVVELRHVHALKGLQSLRICKSFTAPLDEYIQWLLTPPSAVLPQLEQFEYTAP